MQEARSKPSGSSENVTLAPTESLLQSSAKPPGQSRATGCAPAAGIRKGNVPCPAPQPPPAQVRLEAGKSRDLQRSRCSPRWLPLLGTPVTATSRGILRQAPTGTGTAREGEQAGGSEPPPGTWASRSSCATAGGAAGSPQSSAAAQHPAGHQLSADQQGGGAPGSTC